MKSKKLHVSILILGLILLSAIFFFWSCAKKSQPSKEPIKIGAVFAATGGAAFLGMPEVKTTEMLVKQINDKGGINGRPIKVIIKDTEGNPEKTLSFTKQLIEEEKVIAILGSTRSGTTMAIKDFCEENKTILISCAAAEEIVIPIAKYVFKTPQKDSYAAMKIFETMKKLNIKKIGVVVGNSGYGLLGKEQLEKYAPDYGIEIAIAEAYGINETDLTGLLTKVKGMNVQAVVNWSIFPIQSLVAKNMKQIGFNVPLFQSHGFGNIKYVEVAGEAAEGILFPCGRLLAAEELPDNHPQKKVLVKYKNDYETQFNEPVSTFGGHAYDAFMILVEAIKKAGPDKEKIRDAIENMKGFAGTGGIFNFSPAEHNGLDLDSLVMYIVKDGKFTIYEE